MLWQFDVSWQAAASVAAVLALLWLPLRHSTRARGPFAAAFVRESAIILGLFALWQLAGDVSVMGETGAVDRGRWLWHAERVVHLPSEASLQRVVLPHHLLVQFMNVYYGWVHFPSLVIFLVWLFLRHRDRYRRVRNAVIGFTGLSLLVQLIPVAPPRLVPGLGVIDTPALYKQSVYGPVGKGIADQLSAMPSVHVGWAVLVGVVVVLVSRSRWRWLALVHTGFTFVFVAATGNHYWLDGIVSIALLALVAAVIWRRPRRSTTGRRSVAGDEAVALAVPASG